MKKILILFSIFSIFFILPTPITALSPCDNPSDPPRYTECDACGYCQNRPAPDNWQNCARCLYPSLAPGVKAEENQTLIVCGEINEKARAITPALGKYYTQLGCIANINSFTDPAAVGGVLNFALNRLVFPIVGVLAFLSLIYGAFLLTTAQSNPEQIARGKSYIIGAIVGLLFVLGVVFIIGFIAGDILKIPLFAQSKVSSDLSRIKDAIDQLKTDTGKLPGGEPATSCTPNDEASINTPASGLYSQYNPTLFPNWNGPYLTEELVDPNGNSYIFDPDYSCRDKTNGERVKGCEGLELNNTSAHGPHRVVQAIVYVGPDGDSDYCYKGGSPSCIRKDEDNEVLVLCGG